MISPSLIPFCGPTYTHQEWIRLNASFFNMSTYDMCRKSSKIEGNDLNYIDGRPRLHGNIVGYINSSKGRGFLANYEFPHDKEEFMSKKAKNNVCIIPVVNLKPRDELLIYYNFRIPIPPCKKHLESGDPNVIIKLGPKH